MEKEVEKIFTALAINVHTSDLKYFKRLRLWFSVSWGFLILFAILMCFTSPLPILWVVFALAYGTTGYFNWRYYDRRVRAVRQKLKEVQESHS